MSEMIERVAQRLSIANHEGRVWAELVESQRNFWRTQANAAIEAMRDPTEQMMDAGRRVHPYDCDVSESWPVMIDEALR